MAGYRAMTAVTRSGIWRSYLPDMSGLRYIYRVYNSDMPSIELLVLILARPMAGNFKDNPLLHASNEYDYRDNAAVRAKIHEVNG